MILAGITLYNPDINRLDENINAIYNQVDKVILVDNGSNNIDEITYYLDENVICDMVLIRNESNKGIATAMKQIVEYAIAQDYDWVLTLDQDSVCMPELIKTYKKYFDYQNIGILTCNIVDRNYYLDSGFKKNEKYREVRFCISSASLISIKAYSQMDGFDEKMFIDCVDYDFCLNMKKHNFKVLKINYDGVLHEVGHGKSVKFFNRRYITYNHSPFRQYYMARNHFYIIHKYPDEFNRIREIIHEIRVQLIILLYEKDKIKKILSRWKGIKEQKLM